MRFTANLSMLFTEVALIERFQAAKKCGFDAVEIQFPYQLSPAMINEQLTKHQLQLVLFNVDAGDLLQGGEGLAAVPEKTEQFRNAVAQAVEYAKILKPEFINVLPGRCIDQQRLEEYLQTYKINLEYAVASFASLGITTVFEAINTHDMPAFLIHSGEQMLQILEAINHPMLLIQYDIYHMHRMGENVAEFINQHAKKIGHIQFADNPGRGQPGTGEINFEKFFAVIEQSDYQGWVGAEYKPVGLTEASLAWFAISNHQLHVAQ
jgi:hydroxypyruvate isomerase